LTWLGPVILPAYTTYEDGNDSVLKRRHVKFRRRGITPSPPPKKKEYNKIQFGKLLIAEWNQTAKVGNNNAGYLPVRSTKNFVIMHSSYPILVWIKAIQFQQ
jgi:hypothetical protein